MSESTGSETVARSGGSRSSWPLALLVVAGMGLYWMTRGSHAPAEGWGSDFQAALKQANSGQRSVLVFFSAFG